MASTNKIEQYFSSMNSLSARISSDIRNVEENILKVTFPEGDEIKMSYNEKCTAIDKYLVDDVLEMAKKRSKIRSDKGQSILNKNLKPTWPANHLKSMILFVSPSKPEKYVFDEVGGVWLDEHSAPFSFCKISQAKCCSLGKKLARDLSANDTDDALAFQRSKSLSHVKSRQETEQESDSSTLNCEEMNPVKHLVDPDEEPPKKTSERTKQGGRSFFGVNVMDFMGGQTKPTKLRSTESATRSGSANTHGVDEDESEEKALEEDKLPQQKQNLELIAELQAKLKRTNQVQAASETDLTERNSNAVMKKPVEQMKKGSSEEQGLPKVKKGSKESRSSKVKKPKAPPPPPPPPTKIEPPVTKSVDNAPGTSNKGPVPMPKQSQLAVTEQLKSVMASVKKKQAQKVPTEQKINKDLMRPQQACPSQPVKGEVSVTEKQPINVGQKSVNESGAEFCVDVSSPCKIATPKTGLDFLDNW